MLDLDSLNPQQSEAVRHGEGPLLVLAGAGSGKTRVLTYRIAHLIEKHDVSPHEILAVTFTNKAAREMRERLVDLVGDRISDLTVGTFHSTCARWLRRYAPKLGLPSSFAIYDDADSLALCKRALEETEVNDEEVPPRLLRSMIDRMKNQALDPAKLSPGPTWSEGMIQAGRRYEELLHQLGALDFGSLITGMVRLLTEHSDVRRTFQRRYRHVLVDEYQDVNHAQYLLIDKISGSNGNLCVVGDDDQSIYGFRGANVRAILEFERDHADAHVVRLEQNYRSKGNILEAAGAVISCNAGRHGKQLWTDDEDGEKIRLGTFPDDRAEARWVTSEVLDAQSRGRDSGEIAIFYRTNAQSRVLEEELVRQGVRYVLLGGTRFYDRREVKDALAYLRSLVNPHDDISLLRIINTPTRGIGNTTQQKLLQAARDTGRSISSVIDLLETDPSLVNLGKASRSRVLAFRELLTNLRERVAQASLSGLVEGILIESGYLERLRAEGTHEAETRAENLEELVGAAHEAETGVVYPDTTTAIEAFLERAALVTAMDENDDGRGALSLMTLHNSKGLEFPLVFLVGMEEGVFPHIRSMDEGTIEEERRLCYVGMTRAREELVLTRARHRILFGTSQNNPASRFLREIPASLVQPVGLFGDVLEDLEPSPVKESLQKGIDRLIELGEHSSEELDTDEPRIDYSVGQEFSEDVSATPLRVGTVVNHPKFGAGVVRRKEGTGGATKLTIQFERYGIKKLIARYAPLQIMGQEGPWHG
ncbi:MAG: 3'-5' exonuclease [Candidatus Binatia bacterium]|nr:3'-5' exonuclease [Candidatus Binatia bacterium]MDG1959407.1 3'-5' exonuclease [Candidatus Binatia bacterium]HAC80496.1 ATP-dependent DNA helicase PcrA [Deltaproteobacteria bacterium]